MLNRPLSEAELASWKRDHWLRLPCPFDSEQLARLVSWTGELEAWPEVPDCWMKYFEKGAGGDERLLCRVENFIPYHEGFRDLILGAGLMAALEDLMGEAACLFKEKINYKLPGGGGFEALRIFLRHGGHGIRGATHGISASRGPGAQGEARGPGRGPRARARPGHTL